MKENLIREIEQAMLPYLDNAQMKQLQNALNRVLWNKQITIADPSIVDEPNDLTLMNLFLSSKKVEGCSDKTLRYYKATIEKMLTTLNVGVTHITTDNIRQYLARYEQESECSKANIDNIRRILSSFFSWLEDENYILKSPVRRIHKIKTTKPVKDVYTDEALEIMRDNCGNLRDLAIIDLLASSGIRVGELVKLNIADVDFDSRECIVLGKGRDLLEMKVFLDFESVRLGRHSDFGRDKAALLPIGHCVHRCNEGGYISSSLPRQIWIDAPEITLPRPSDGLGDVACAAVVGTDGKGPVAEDLVCVLEVACCGVHRLLDIHTLIHEAVDFQAVTASRPIHKLPDALGSGARGGDRVEHRLDDRHILQFDREAVIVENLLENREIILAQSKRPAHHRRHLLRIEDDIVLDIVIERQGDEGIHILKPAYHFLVGDIGCELHRVHIIGVDRIEEIVSVGVLVPQVKEAVGHLSRVLHSGFVTLQHGGNLSLLLLDAHQAVANGL